MDTRQRTPSRLREFVDSRLVRYTSLARELGITASHLTRLLDGERPLTRSQGERLVELFGEEAQQFLPEEARDA